MFNTQFTTKKKVNLNLDLMQNKKLLNLWQNAVFQHKIMKNTVYDKKGLSQPRVDAKRIFYRKWLICSETQVLTQNGVRPRKTLLSTQNNEKHSLRQKRLSQPRLDAKRIF